ncbi:MAG TPA: lysylphosphatidylglycerol synthase transmembrane domain-containing protein [Polyangia bacterium]|nr:lysylphosphatidylglycerol synthase transmembrane domain-containing protein [Polyangia bacterium]
MKGLVGRVALGVAAGVAVYVGFSIWANARQVAEALARFRWSLAALACLLAACNYLVRFGRWHYYLRVLGLPVAPRDSLLVFLAGFSLTVTPGKLGEAVKAFLLRASHGYSVTRTAPIVVAERVTDLLALLLLALAGVFHFDVDRRFLVAGAAVVIGGVLVVSIDPLAELALGLAAGLPGVRRFAPRLREMHAATAALLHPKPLVLATAISTLSWFLECLAFATVVRGFPGAVLDLRAATFIYAAMTVAGALSFLPGGLGVTEAGMLALLVRFGAGLTRGSAAAATFVTRACTLWFAVALGLPALALYARRKHVALPAAGVEPTPAPESAAP